MELNDWMQESEALFVGVDSSFIDDWPAVTIYTLKDDGDTETLLILSPQQAAFVAQYLAAFAADAVKREQAELAEGKTSYFVREHR